MCRFMSACLVIVVLVAGVCLGQQCPSDSYAIRPGDRLDILVWKEPDISRMVEVCPEGTISLHNAGDIPIAGKTTKEAEQEITERLEKYVHAPRVRVAFINHGPSDPETLFWFHCAPALSEPRHQQPYQQAPPRDLFWPFIIARH